MLSLIDDCLADAVRFYGPFAADVLPLVSQRFKRIVEAVQPSGYGLRKVKLIDLVYHLSSSMLTLEMIGESFRRRPHDLGLFEKAKSRFRKLVLHKRRASLRVEERTVRTPAAVDNESELSELLRILATCLHSSAVHEFKFRTEDVTKPDAFRLPSEFLDRLAAPSTSMGHVDMLVLQKADFTDTSNGILQKLPLIAGQVHCLYVHGCQGLPGAEVDDAFLLRCVERGVIMLQVSRFPFHNSDEQIADPLAISEDGILRFCFGHRPVGVPSDAPRQIELYSARLSPHFARRFVEASEQCLSTHGVCLSIHATAAGQPNLSGIEVDRTSDGYILRNDSVPVQIIPENSDRLKILRGDSLQISLYFRKLRLNE